MTSLSLKHIVCTEIESLVPCLFSILFSGGELAKRWKYTRDYYRDSKNRRSKVVTGKKSGSGALSQRDKAAEWPHYNSMEFLDEFMKSRK